MHRGKKAAALCYYPNSSPGEMSMDSFLRPMSTAEILDRTFNLYRNNFLLFAGIAILPAALGLILDLAGVAARITVPVRGRGIMETQLMFLGFEFLVFFVMTVIGGGIATGVTVYAVYSQQLGQSASLTGSYRKALAQWFKVIVTAILVFLLVMAVILLAGGLMLAGSIWVLFQLRTGETTTVVTVIGAVVAVFLMWLYLTARYSLVVPSLLLDKTSIFRSFRRSRFLARGTTNRIFLVFLLTAILGLVLSWTFQIPIVVSGIRRHYLFARICSDVVQFISRMLAGPIATIAVALIYIDQRVRKEAFDIQLMMDAIQETDNQPAALAQGHTS
ncbi:MAG TPA: hypothetical protein VI685_11480 [Candidatus Angelobacter sp.]